MEAADTASHLLGDLFRVRDLARELAEQQRRYGRAVEAMYRYACETERMAGDTAPFVRR